ncbi:MAG: hypothetical protein AB7P03_01045 [Kofleriaceae bacterium]
MSALDRRLEAANPDFRAFRTNLATASMTLLVVAAAHLVLGLVLYVFAADSTLAPPTAAELTGARFDLLSNVFVAAAMIGCFVWARSAPIPALTTALVIWIAVQVVSLLFGGVVLISLRISVAKLIAFALLVRGIVSAVSAARLRAKLAPPRPAGLPGARVISRP